MLCVHQTAKAQEHKACKHARTHAYTSDGVIYSASKTHTTQPPRSPPSRDAPEAGVGGGPQRGICSPAKRTTCSDGSPVQSGRLLADNIHRGKKRSSPSVRDRTHRRAHAVTHCWENNLSQSGSKQTNKQNMFPETNASTTSNVKFCRHSPGYDAEKVLGDGVFFFFGPLVI